MIVRLGRLTAHARAADERWHWALDHEGRLLAGHDPAGVHRVGLDVSVLSRSPRDRVPRRLSTAEGDAVLARAGVALSAARDLLARGEARLELDPPGEGKAAAVPAREAALALLERAAARAARPGTERAAFGAAYRPVRMVPPDCAQALVLQVTEGCSWGRCSFCTLYGGVPFRVKDERALGAHLDGVAGLLGAGARLRRGVFLGDANALLAPLHGLLAALDGARARFPDAARSGAHAFVDAFSGRGRTEDELRALAGAGLRRVTVGLESGHEPLLRLLRKPSTPADVQALVARARRAGLSVGVTVLAGAGGRLFAEAHVADTTRVVRGLGLGRGDLVFVSPLVPEGEAPAVALREVEDQAARLGAALAAGPWRVVRYDVRRSLT